MGKRRDAKKLDQGEIDGKSGKASRTAYICFSVIFIVGIGLCFYYIFDQTRNKAFWSVVSEEEIEKESFFNRDCAAILKDLPNGPININDIESKLQKYSGTEHGKIFYSGIKTFASVQAKVKDKKDIEFAELIEGNSELSSFFNCFASNRSTKKEMLYPTLLASDIMVYIFNHRNIIDIHLDDRILGDADEECLIKFYQMAFLVFDYQKSLFNRHYSKSDFFQNTSTFDLLALTLYSKAVAATKGKNDKYKIGEILTTISENKFKVGGEKSKWYSWLAKDLAEIKNSTFTGYRISNRPPDVRGRWLI